MLTKIFALAALGLLAAAGPVHSQCQPPLPPVELRIVQIGKLVTARGAVLTDAPCRYTVQGALRPADEFQVHSPFPGRVSIQVKARGNVPACVVNASDRCVPAFEAEIGPKAPLRLIVSTLAREDADYEIEVTLHGSSCSAPEQPVLLDLDSFSHYDFSKNCQAADGIRTELFGFEFGERMTATVEALPDDESANAALALELRCGSGHWPGVRSLTRQFEPGPCTLAVRTPSKWAGPYTVRFHGPCQWTNLAPNRRITDDFSLLDCRANESMPQLAGTAIGRGYRLTLQQRSLCQIKAVREAGPMRVLLVNGNAVTELGQQQAAETVLRPGEHSIWVEGTDGKFGEFSLTAACRAAEECPSSLLMAGSDVKGRFTGQECKVCDYARSADCGALAQAYRLTVENTPLRVTIESARGELIDWQGRPVLKSVTATERGSYLFMVSGLDAGDEYRLLVSPVGH